MRVAYAATYNALDVHKFSGSGFFMGKSLADQGIEVICLPPLKEKFEYFLKGKQWLYKYIFRKIYCRDRNPLVLKGYARQIEKHLRDVEADLLFCPGSLPITYLNWNKPTVFWTDMTFYQVLAYAGPKRFSRKFVEMGHRMERKALERCTLAIYCSEWAARSAIEYYQAPPDKVEVVPYGANLDTNFSMEEIDQAISQRSRSACNLLFIGVDWERKGGPRVLKIAEELNRQGLKTFLHVVGCTPPVDDLPDFVMVHGFVSKKTVEGSLKLEKLLHQAHFLMLLSEAEACAIVLYEANAFGVPCIASNLGGIPSIIRDGVNGKLFSENDDIQIIAEAIDHLFSDYDAYIELARSAFDEYTVRLNWKASGAKVKEHLETIL